MCEFHDNYPYLPLELSLTGSQCLEDLFSELRSWNMNQHTFNSGEALHTLRSIATLKKLRVDPNAPPYTRPRKWEDIWYKQYRRIPYIKLCWTDYPSNLQVIQAWKLIGLCDAQQLAWKVGMAPSGYNPQFAPDYPPDNPPENHKDNPPENPPDNPQHPPDSPPDSIWTSLQTTPLTSLQLITMMYQMITVLIITVKAYIPMNFLQMFLQVFSRTGSSISNKISQATAQVKVITTKKKVQATLHLSCRC